MLGLVHDQGFSEVTDAHAAIFRYHGPHGRQPSEIAAGTGLSKQAVNDLLGQLERWGYLTRERHPDDGRARIVLLTSRGHKLQEAWRAAGRKVEREWAKRIGEPDWSTFRRVLDRLARGNDD